MRSLSPHVEALVDERLITLENHGRILGAKRERLIAEQAARTAVWAHADRVAHFERWLEAALDRAGVRYEALWDEAVRPSPLAR